MKGIGIDLAALLFTALVLACVVLSACGASEVSETRVVIYATQPPVVTSIAPPAAPVVERVFPTDIHSVRFRQPTTLRKEPRGDADRIGVIGKDARAAAVASALGDGCKARWIRIAPRGWTCETAIEPSTDEPTATVDEVVLGVYGTVRGADVPTSVRAAGISTIDGVRYWRTSGGELIDESTIAQFSPSKFHGVALDAATPLPAWVRGHDDPYKPVRIFAAPHGKPSGELARRTVVSVLETSGDFVRVTETAWIPRKDLRIATLSEPPPGTGKTEKWFDVDRDEQVLVAYEGTRPVYATLVSTGKWDHETPTIISRIQSKLQMATMINDRGEKYSVADVPWTMYYDGHYALHTSYWHDGFGGQRSHGCVNLAPRDARALYQWSSPDVPPGWIAVYGDADNPGSLVRVRSRSVPAPAFRGYARVLHDRDALAVTD